MERICVLGLGYIGLPTASMFATRGFPVIGVDVSPRIVELLNHGDVHIEEPGLRMIAQAALRSGNLCVRSVPEPADVFIIAVPTPFLDAPPGSPKCADLSHVRAAAEAIAPMLQPGNLVVLESTSPPGTTQRLVAPILEQSGLRVGEQLALAYCPERVLPGRILEELVRNNRIIGGVNPASAERARTLYSSFVEGSIYLTDAVTAEMVKLMENTFRDVNIALANEFARVAERLEVDVWEAIALANRHPRVNILRPGPGVGGHCIAVDPWFIAERAPDLTRLIQTARSVNDAMPAHVVRVLEDALDGVARESRRRTIACLGLAYKADVDDIRESPAFQIAALLQQKGYRVRAYDPHVPCGRLALQVDSIEQAVQEADAVLILTDHDEFRQLRPEALPLRPGVVIVDTRNTCPAGPWREAGFCFVRLGDGARR